MDSTKKVLLVHGFGGAPEIFRTLKNLLKDFGCEVVAPDFSDNMSNEEFYASLDKYRDYISSDTSVIAHSIGSGMFLKYLAVKGLKVGRFISLAGHFGTNENNLSEAELTYVREAIAESFCLFSNNDQVASYKDLQDFPKRIKGNGILVENIGHMDEITELPGVAELAAGRTTFELSCGCIVVDGDKILLEREISRHGDRFWSFPKGHIEPGETEEQTALRETKEEVGLDVEIIDKNPIDNNYFLHDGKILKRVAHFLARPTGSRELKLQAEEVEQARFMSLAEARELADFEYTKITIDEVKERLGI